MTLLVAGAASLLVLLLSGFLVELADASTLKARAQLAADAAALAAVAESAPYGQGRQQQAAERFATVNGAQILECLCEAGATAVEVKVSVEDVVASARAVFDPELVTPMYGIVPSGRLDPLLAQAVDRLLDAANGAVHLVSGHRSTQEQEVLWADALARYGDPEVADDWVARPGTSMHERGLAVDLGGDLGLAARLVGLLHLPLHRPLPHEPHHFELVPDD